MLDIKNSQELTESDTKWGMTLKVLQRSIIVTVYPLEMISWKAPNQYLTDPALSVFKYIYICQLL